MTTIYFITHPEVIPDPSLPITMWDYTDRGLSRWQKIMGKLWIKDIEKIYTSPEPRALKAAQQVADSLGFKLHVRDDLGEIRHETDKVLTPEQHAEGRALFYQFPDKSVSGWETAVEAQNRIVGAVNGIIAESPSIHHLAIVSHEDLGTLLACRVRNIPIQPLDGMDVGTLYHWDQNGFIDWEKLEL